MVCDAERVWQRRGNFNTASRYVGTFHLGGSLVWIDWCAENNLLMRSGCGQHLSFLVVFDLQYVWSLFMCNSPGGGTVSAIVWSRSLLTNVKQLLGAFWLHVSFSCAFREGYGSNGTHPEVPWRGVDCSPQVLQKWLTDLSFLSGYHSSQGKNDGNLCTGFFPLSSFFCACISDEILKSTRKGPVQCFFLFHWEVCFLKLKCQT